ncbi:MAG: hypothetical protein ACFFER_17525, partial [Candidatus Thorarchaeota archaeon]
RNLAFMLLIHFYVIALFGDIALLGIFEALLGVIVLPLVCLVITVAFASYLGDIIDHRVTRDVLIGGFLGYIISMSLLVILI